ncbi:hypothetical protein [Devosia sp.]|uniref:hypothetical protein n=1 Tax=Devosia sp. TaxID=1871048 RepID=UPI002EE13EFB
MTQFALILLPESADAPTPEDRIVKFEVVKLRRRALRRKLGRRRRQARYAPTLSLWQRRPPRLRRRRKW